MKANELRHLITVQSPPTSQDEFGQLSGSWSNVKNIWCKVISLTASENLQTSALSNETTYIVTTYITSISSQQRLYWGEKSLPLDIISVIDSDNTNRWMTIMCKSGVNNV